MAYDFTNYGLLTKFTIPGMNFLNRTGFKTYLVGQLVAHISVIPLLHEWTYLGCRVGIEAYMNNSFLHQEPTCSLSSL